MEVQPGETRLHLGVVVAGRREDEGRHHDADDRLEAEVEDYEKAALDG